MSFGYGLVHCKSRKNKLSTKSSTEAELFSKSDYLPCNIYIQPLVKNKCLGGGFGFCRKLTRTKTQQITDKASKHNGSTVFLGFGLTWESTVVVSTLSNYFSSLHYTSSQFEPTYPFYLGLRH